MMTMTRYFNKSHNNFNPPPLDLTLIGSPVLQPKSTPTRQYPLLNV